MFSSRVTVSAVLAAVAAAVNAQGPISTQGLSILVPGGPNLWWVAESDNTLIWTCQQTAFSNFTVLIGNTNPSVMNAPQAILAQENNFDCSKLITANNFGQAPGDGYFVQLSNPFNETDVWAQSDTFEIKPKGSAYPDASSTPTGTGSPSSTGGPSGSSTGSGSASPTGGSAQTSNSPSPSPSNNAAVGTKASLTGLAAFAAAAFGIVFA